ncbi:hypothetical protein FOMG_17484 [Fusarium oxysporum f. sp. melonis 26406]|uniref:Uncharacterized protein n=1 Tax=Fusarium oxysporum f. sp. melonis 26406 TaxID=1089452 RepID=W9ZXX1_FUSOX|nr:hypothetical protein FOMG_17484 [Fusarium oxysporum f. sp. melonis 26406]
MGFMDTLEATISESKYSHEGRHVYLLNIDSSGGAHDISHDAWNFLKVGRSASEDPEQGGGIPMSYNYVHASNCNDLLDNGKLPISAANLMGYVESCLKELEICKYGVDGKCHLNPAVSNLPECPGGLESTKKLDHKVENILFGSGKSAAAP